MIKLILFTGIIFCTISSYGQSSNLSVGIKIPSRANKITDGDLKKRSEIRKRSFAPKVDNIGSPHNSYTIDGMIVTIVKQERRGSSNYLLDERLSERESLSKRLKDIKVNYVKISKFRNTNYLLYEYQEQNDIFLRFESDWINDKGVFGIIQYQEGEEVKAQKVLSEVLNGIKLK